MVIKDAKNLSNSNIKLSFNTDDFSVHKPLVLSGSNIGSNPITLNLLSCYNVDVLPINKDSKLQTCVDYGGFIFGEQFDNSNNDAYNKLYDSVCVPRTAIYSMRVNYGLHGIK